MFFMQVKHFSTDGVLPQFLSEGKHTQEMEKDDDMMITADGSTSNCNETNDDLVRVFNLGTEFENTMNLNVTINEQQFVEYIHESNQNDNLHSSILEDSSHSTELETQTGDVVKGNEYLLTEFKVPPLLCRHPIPATGRDESISNVKLVLDITLQNLDRDKAQKDRILFALDHKILQNVIKLIKGNAKYQQFFLEFPALHLRNSKITNLFAAYEKAGLSHMLQFMKDSEEETDWHKLITLKNIKTATKNNNGFNSFLLSTVLKVLHLPRSFASQ
ncbi:hypothetical protein DPMN_135218 [Dreissena polymorpha]|uniref:Uncharacterized protein n=1 Tax=Dreissena polymorpha TaxID=45954 RepID=A0A9D4FXM3_DREPO|nr:hypothetical protein DPMN_135218 [Dreissena polymorpha]